MRAGYVSDTVAGNNWLHGCVSHKDGGVDVRRCPHAISPHRSLLCDTGGLRPVTDELAGAGDLAIKIQNINVGTRSARYNVRLVGKLAPYET